MYTISCIKTSGMKTTSNTMNQNQLNPFVGITLLEQLAHVSIAILRTFVEIRLQLYPTDT